MIMIMLTNPIHDLIPCVVALPPGGYTVTAERQPGSVAGTLAIVARRHPLLASGMLAGLVATAVGASCLLIQEGIDNSEMPELFLLAHASAIVVTLILICTCPPMRRASGAFGSDDGDARKRKQHARKQSAATKGRRARLTREQQATLDLQARCYGDGCRPIPSPNGADRFFDYGLVSRSGTGLSFEFVEYKLFRDAFGREACAHEVTVLSTLARHGVPHIEPPIMAFSPIPHRDHYLGNSWARLVAVSVFPRNHRVVEAVHAVAVAPVPQRLDVHKLRRFARHLLETLEGMHRAGFAHLNVSLDNLRIRHAADGKEELVLGGFEHAMCLDVALVARSPTVNRSATTDDDLYNDAPELASGGCITAAADSFSAGRVLEDMLDLVRLCDAAAREHAAGDESPRAGLGQSPLSDYEAELGPEPVPVTEGPPAKEQKAHVEEHVATVGAMELEGAHKPEKSPQLDGIGGGAGWERAVQQPLQDLKTVLMGLAMDFVKVLMTANPDKRPLATDALRLPFLSDPLCPCCDAESTVTPAAARDAAAPQRTQGSGFEE